MSEPSVEITIKLTPRAAAYLKALVVANETRIAEQRRAAEEEKAERLRAAAESRHPEPMFCAPHRRVPELTFDQIAERALERGAAQMLSWALHTTWGPGDDCAMAPMVAAPYPPPVYPHF